MISDEDLYFILDSWSFWSKSFPSSYPREVTLPDSLSNQLALVIQGVRRCGKTTLMYQLAKRYELKAKQCAFINFEDPKLAHCLDYKLLDQICRIFQEHRDANEKLYLFLDEIQNVHLWEKWLRTQLERPSNLHFIISGSNSSLLSGELASVLTGRYIKLELYPYNFQEFQTVFPNAHMEDFLNQGGFPFPITQPNPEMILRDYFESIVEKDIRERLGSRSSLQIRQLIKMVYEASGSELSFRKIAGALGLTAETVHNYLAMCEQAYLVFECPYFSFSEQKRSKRNRKYYPIDTGLRNTIISKTGQDLGKNFECVVFLELKKRYRDVFYWKDKGEVDFVVQTENGITPIQVSLSEIKPRHERALEEFYSHFPQANEAVIITKENGLDFL